MQSCQVVDYLLTVSPTSYIYVPGAPPVTTFAYTVTQNPDCGYPNTITVDKSVDFVTHNPETSDFTVFTDDMANAGGHYITVLS